MSMNGDNLGDELLAAIDTLSDADKSNRVKVWRKIGAAIVAHIQTNARVTVNATVAVGIPVQVVAPALTGATTATGTAATNNGTIA